MATYLLRNSLNPSKVVGCTISLRQLTNKGEKGEPVWVIEVRTVEPHKDGGEIPPAYVHYNNSINFDEAVKEATEIISRQIDWSPLDDDIKAPFIYSISPSQNETVDIGSGITFILKDSLPTIGIDPDSIQVTVNGLDVTDKLRISGTPSEYKVVWNPSIRVQDTY